MVFHGPKIDRFERVCGRFSKQQGLMGRWILNRNEFETPDQSAIKSPLILQLSVSRKRQFTVGARQIASVIICHVILSAQTILLEIRLDFKV